MKDFLKILLNNALCVFARQNLSKRELLNTKNVLGAESQGRLSGEFEPRISRYLTNACRAERVPS